jgi:hypothetical protein
MATYHLHIAEEPPNLRARIRGSLAFTIAWLLGMVFLERFLQGYWGSPAVWIVTGAICLLGGLLTSSLWPPKLRSLDFRIDDFGIRSFWNDKPLRRVNSNRVRYVRERRGISGARLVVSEDALWLKRQFAPSSISIPKRLAKPEEYEQIKAMALGWLENSQR